MACFLVPAALAVVTTAFRREIPDKYHVDWLNMLLWGGVLALALEHISHGEIVPYFPFLSAMGSAADTTTMIFEMATIGVMMMVACVLVWLAMVMVYDRFLVNEDDPEGASASV